MIHNFYIALLPFQPTNTRPTPTKLSKSQLYPPLWTTQIPWSQVGFVIVGFHCRIKMLQTKRVKKIQEIELNESNSIVNHTKISQPLRRPIPNHRPRFKLPPLWNPSKLPSCKDPATWITTPPKTLSLH